MYWRDFHFRSTRSLKLKLCLLTVIIYSLCQIFLLQRFSNNYFSSSLSFSFLYNPSQAQQKASVDCIIPSINILDNGDFSKLNFSLNQTKSEFGERNAWWADGKKAFRVNAGGLQVTCHTRSLGLYQYVKFKSPDLLSGFQISFRTNFGNSTSSNREAEGVGNGERREQFRGIAVFLRGYNANETNLEFFQEEGFNIYTRNLPFRPYSIMLVIGCVGYEGWIKIDSVSLSPVSRECKNFSRQDLLGSSEYDCDCKETIFTAAALPTVEHDNFTHRIKVVDNSARVEVNVDIVSIVTHTTIDRLNTVAFALSQWGFESAATIAIYDNANIGRDNVLAILDLSLQEYGLTVKSLRSTRIVVVEAKENEAYPINIMRNIAMNFTSTTYALLLDADLIPSTDCKHEITKILRSDLFQEERYNVALVIPVFEDNLEVRQESLFKGYIKRSRSKKKLRSLVKKGIFSVYKSVHQPRAHAATNYERWWGSSDPYQIDYERQYEPFVVVKVKKNPLLPRFDNRFVGYGWNKVSFIYDLHSAGFKFHVVPNSWLIHRTHEKTEYSLSFAISPSTRIKNRAVRFEWLMDNKVRLICR